MEKERAKALYRSGLEERHKREIEELTASYLREIQGVKEQALLEINELKDAVGQLQGDENRKTRQG